MRKLTPYEITDSVAPCIATVARLNGLPQTTALVKKVTQNILESYGRSEDISGNQLAVFSFQFINDHPWLKLEDLICFLSKVGEQKEKEYLIKYKLDVLTLNKMFSAYVKERLDLNEQWNLRLKESYDAYRESKGGYVDLTGKSYE